MEMSLVWVSCSGSTWAVMQTSSVGLSVGMAFLLHHSNKCFKLPNYVLLENELVKKCASLSDLPAIVWVGVTQGTRGFGPQHWCCAGRTAVTELNGRSSETLN